MKTALITGITGQDGSYLAEFLLKKGYKVYGMVRRTSTGNDSRIGHLNKEIHLVDGDMTDQASLFKIVKQIQPDEVYNLAAQSFVGSSWDQPDYVMNVNAIGNLRLLSALKELKPDARFYQASSSEMFGKVKEVPQTEKTEFHPRSPYGVSKVTAYWNTILFRESHGMHCSNGILFNHESPRRGMEFVTRKITDGVARIKLGLKDHISLGNLDAKRDWGFAGDYIEAMWLMLQQDEPDEYVVATGETHSVREFVQAAFEAVGIQDWEKFVKQDPRFMRPSDVELLLGDASKIRNKLGWEPKVKFKELVKMMVDADIKRLENGRA